MSSVRAELVEARTQVRSLSALRQAQGERSSGERGHAEKTFRDDLRVPDECEGLGGGDRASVGEVERWYNFQV